MLSALLPGLRDLRTPLAVGYLWLFVLWLMFHHWLPDPQTATGLSKDVLELGRQLGRPAVFAALTFVAYGIGSILADRLFDPMILVWVVAQRIAPERLPHLVRPTKLFTYNIGLSMNAIEDLTDHVERRVASMVDEVDEKQVWYALQFVIHHEQEPASREVRPGAITHLCANRVEEEFDQIAVRLQAQNKDLFETYDRKRSEAEFRGGIALPLILIILLVAIQSSPFWLILLPIPVILAIQGLMRQREAQEQIVQALMLDIVDAPVIQRMTERLSRGLGARPSS